MKKEDILLDDIKRILLGNAPPEFLLEVFIRTLLVYVTLLVVVKLLGKRMSGQVTLLEMAVMITLGAIVGSPIQIPDRGIVMGIALLIFILIFQRIISTWSFRYAWIERIVQGKTSLLVKEGVIDVNTTKRARITQQQLFALLREHKVHHLGAVDRVYLETTGVLSIFKAPSPKPGLSALPSNDPALKNEQNVAEGVFACIRCGFVEKDRTKRCPNCNEQHWTSATI